MKSYLALLLAYLDVHHTVDYALLGEAFHVTSRQIIGWMEMLYQGGYIVWENGGFCLTPLGQQQKSTSWLELSSHKKRNDQEDFRWDFLYIPKDFKIE